MNLTFLKASKRRVNDTYCAPELLLLLLLLLWEERDDQQLVSTMPLILVQYQGSNPLFGAKTLESLRKIR
jgi:hypothetical protein